MQESIAVFSHPEKENHLHIYTVTCIYDIPPYCNSSLTKDERKSAQHEYDSHGGSRTFGWWETFEKAKQVVEENAYDIHECSYKYAVIEKIANGMLGGFMDGYEEHWYEWVEGKYVAIDKPKLLKSIVGWSLG